MALTYEQLSDPEREVWGAIADGKLVTLPLDAARADDPAEGPTWGKNRLVRAQLLYELLTERAGPEDTRPRALKLAGARITGALDLEGATLACPLTLIGCYFEQPITLDAAEAIVIRLTGCHLFALAAEQLTTRGNLELNGGFTAEGEIKLIGANIGGSLSFETARLDGRGEIALCAEGVRVERNLNCDGALFVGQVNLLGATIGGALTFHGAKLGRTGKTALNGNRLTVGESISCEAREGMRFDAQGEINLIGANIGGSLNLKGARLRHAKETALRANKVTIGRNLWLDSVDVEGQVDLAGAKIGGTLSFIGAKLVEPGRKKSVDLTGASVTQSVEMRPKSIDGPLDLTTARVGRWRDEWRTRDQKPVDIELSGFVYQTIDGKDPEGQDITVKDRLRLWLPKGAKYSPQPYEQLAAVYRREGSECARTVAIGKQRARRDAVQGRSRPLSKAWSAFLRWTIGYGYQPTLVLIPLAGLLVAGTVIFGYAYPDQLHAAKSGAEQPVFSSFRYTVDLLLPIVNFKQRDAFIATGWIAWLSFGFIFTGWLLGAVVVAGLSGVFKRD